MQIDKLFDETCNLLQEQKKVFNEMNRCATQTFNAQQYSELIDKFNAIEKKRVETHKQLLAMRDKNMESMVLSLKQHYGIKQGDKMTDEWYVILNMNCKYEICRGCPKSGLFKGSLKECDDWIKQKQKDEMKDKISMALKDPVLQQGFEIICKENTELKKQIEKMKCCANCKHNEIIEGEEFCHASRGVCKYYSETFEDDNWELM